MSISRIPTLLLAVSFLGLGFGQASAQEAPTKPTAPALPQEASYRVQAEDVITVFVQDIPESTGEFLVRKDGIITVPMAGEIVAIGKTTKEIGDAITAKLRKEIRDPRVTVNIKSSSIQRVYVMGAVRSAGVLDWKPQWRLTEVIAAAGGLSGVPERTKVLLFRKGTEHKEVPLKKLLVGGDDAANLEVLPGDVVNFQTDVTLRVQVVGQVAKQGMVEVLEGQGVAEVLAAAGGGLPDARLSGAKIVRNGKEIPVDLYAAVAKGDPSLNQTINDGDTVYVPSLLRRVGVIGMVGKPGPITVPDGQELTLTQAVALAGGPVRDAKTDSVAIVRAGADRKPVATKYDLKALLKADKGATDPVLQDGDLVVIAQSGKSKLSDLNGALGVFGIFSRFLFPF